MFDCVCVLAHVYQQMSVFHNFFFLNFSSDYVKNVLLFFSCFFLGVTLYISGSSKNLKKKKT